MDTQNSRQIEIIQAPTVISAGKPPHYPSYCRLFLKLVGPLDQFVSENLAVHGMIANLNEDDTGKNDVGRMMVGHMSHLLSTVTYPLKQLGWTFTAAVVPIEPARKICQSRVDSLTVAFADKRATYFSGHVGQDRVAQLLPHVLRTEDALSYMHQRKHYGLTGVIECALNNQ